MPQLPSETVVDDTSTFDLINDVEEDEKLDLSEKKEEIEEDEKVELDEEEEEVEEKEEKEEDFDIKPLPTRKEIIAAFPDLYKKFPQLNNAFYRERQFTELIGDPNDARELIAKAKSLDGFEQYLQSGEIEKVFQGIKDTSQEAFNKLVDNLLPSLGRVNKDAHDIVIGNIVKHTVAAMAIQAKRKGDDKLREAAELLNEFVFGSSEYEPPVKLSREEKKDDTVNQREQQLRVREFNSAKDDLNTKVDNVLRSTIDAYIDPKDSMSSYVRKNAVREVLETLPELVREDSRFQTLLDNLWKRAYSENYSQASKDRIKSAWLNKAKTVLPAVIKKVRAEALKGLAKKERSDDEETPPTKRGIAPPGKTASSTSSGKSYKEKARAIPQGMSTKDYLLAED